MQYPTETLKIVKKYGCRRNDNPTTTHDSAASSNANPRTGLVVNLGTTSTNREGIAMYKICFFDSILNGTRNKSGDSIYLIHFRSLGNISPRHVGRPHIHSNVNNLPMPPPYTSREPSISQHPMSPPPRYTRYK